MDFNQWNPGGGRNEFAGISSTETSMSDNSWSPNTDVYEVDDGLVIRVELSGMRREDLQLKSEGNMLRISGMRPDDQRPTHGKFLLMEINFGPFETTIELPSGYDLDEAKALYQNGLLLIEVPAEADTHAKSIEIESLTGD
ncbi:MAG: Hsp20/alpha crystallin family protein [Verrucomicrobiota bacterium]|jgi:HSP20 family protein|nr:Hsp20/alpha crystallin family protein [Verrucomicrobiota bacterium]